MPDSTSSFIAQKQEKFNWILFILIKLNMTLNWGCGEWFQSIWEGFSKGGEGGAKEKGKGKGKKGWEKERERNKGKVNGDFGSLIKVFWNNIQYTPLEYIEYTRY